jgi:hypothetical protein
VIGTGDKRGAGKGEEWLLKLAAMPCACLSCRDLVDKICPYIDIRQEREVLVSLQPPPRQNQKRAVNPEDEVVIARVCELLKVEKLTKKPMEAFLRENNIPHNGSKRALADRIVAFCDARAGQATDGEGEASTAGQATDGEEEGDASPPKKKKNKKNPLATDYITTDADLMCAEYDSNKEDEDEEEEEEEEQQAKALVSNPENPEDEETDCPMTAATTAKMTRSPYDR